MMSGVPYAIWEATLTADELQWSSVAESRMNGRGTGFGVALHSALLPLGEGIEGLLYRKAAILCAMSEYTRSRMIDRHALPAERVLVLPHPPSPTFLEALSNARSRMHNREALGDGCLRLLCVGRVDDPRKGIGDLLAAVAYARSAHVSVKLTLVGPYSAKWADRYASLVAASGATVVGKVNVNELARLYLSHDALVLASHQEGFGIVVSEAFHAGLPVIATRCGGPEAVIRASGGGLLTEREPAAMTASFQALGANAGLHHRLSANATRYASAELSQASFACRVRELTQQIIDVAILRRTG